MMANMSKHAWSSNKRFVPDRPFSYCLHVYSDGRDATASRCNHLPWYTRVLHVDTTVKHSEQVADKQGGSCCTCKDLSEQQPSCYRHNRFAGQGKSLHGLAQAIQRQYMCTKPQVCSQSPIRTSSKIPPVSSSPHTRAFYKPKQGFCGLSALKPHGDLGTSCVAAHHSCFQQTAGIQPWANVQQFQIHQQWSTRIIKISKAPQHQFFFVWIHILHMWFLFFLASNRPDHAFCFSFTKTRETGLTQQSSCQLGHLKPSKSQQADETLQANSATSFPEQGSLPFVLLTKPQPGLHLTLSVCLLNITSIFTNKQYPGEYQPVLGFSLSIITRFSDRGKQVSCYRKLYIKYSPPK